MSAPRTRTNPRMRPRCLAQRSVLRIVILRLRLLWLGWVGLVLVRVLAMGVMKLGMEAEVEIPGMDLDLLGVVGMVVRDRMGAWDLLAVVMMAKVRAGVQDLVEARDRMGTRGTAAILDQALLQARTTGMAEVVDLARTPIRTATGPLAQTPVQEMAEATALDLPETLQTPAARTETHWARGPTAITATVATAAMAPTPTRRRCSRTTAPPSPPARQPHTLSMARPPFQEVRPSQSMGR